MKKECENCENFTCFYSKIGCNFIKTNCGRCWSHKDIVGCQDTCDMWEAKVVNAKLQQKEILQTLENTVAQIIAVKEELIK